MKTPRAKPTTRVHAALPRGTSSAGGSAGSKILEAIEEATEVLRSEGPGSPRMTVRTDAAPAPPRAFRTGNVKRVRELLGASQAVLARRLGVNVDTVRSWEPGRRPPRPIACRFLAEIASDPAPWRRRIGPGADA